VSYSRTPLGIEEAAADHGLIAFVANTQDERETQRRRAEMVLDLRVDGLILGDARSDDPALLTEIAAKGLPFVLVNRRVGDHPSATCDNYLGGRLVAEHLLELGHTNAAVIAGLAHASTGIDRPAGFVDRYREAGIDIPDTHIIHSGLDSAAGRVAAERFLSLDPRPTALFAVNDFAAFGAGGAIRDHGLRVGHDIALVGFNNIPLTQELHVPLTSVDSAPHRMGRLAVEMLAKLLAGEEATSALTAPELVVRASSVPGP
jgi:LacI family transcriptional regulator